MASTRCYIALTIQLFFCLIALAGASCPSDSVATDDGECKCVSPCPKHDCQPGLQPVRVQEAIPEKPGFCCPLYECHRQVTLSYATSEESNKQCMDHQGQLRENGETWLDTDPCVTCICQAGEPFCRESMCKSCAQPLPREPGECCPRCPALPPTQPKPVSETDPPCPPLSANCTELRCELGLDVDAKGCALCRCKIREQNEVTGNEDETEDEDEEVEEENEDKDPSGSCPQLDCAFDCPQGRGTDEHGCPICRCLDSCLDERNATRPVGTRWRPEPCRSCACELGGRVFCNETICSVACGNPLPPPPGHCCPLCPANSFDELRGWGTLPIILIVSLALLCVLLMVHLVRGRYRGRLVPSEADFMGFPHHQQYYKCVPVYETHVPVLQHAEKMPPL